MPAHVPDKSVSLPEKADGTRANVVAEMLMLAGWSGLSYSAFTPNIAIRWMRPIGLPLVA